MMMLRALQLLRRSRTDFLEPGLLLDRDLELVEPSAQFIEPYARSSIHPLCINDPMGKSTRQELLNYIQRHPRGRHSAEPANGRAAMYTFWMRLLPRSNPPIEIAGRISLRLGDTNDLRMYLGHFGYNVQVPARGHHLAERACRLLFPLARKHGMTELWITANPDNIASRRTCENLGAKYIDTVQLPEGHPLYLAGDREKCRYRIEI